MTTNPAFNLPGPGLTRQAYLDLLAAGHETGWYDQHGDPAPWPEDFLDPDSGWQTARGGENPADPGNVTF
jgi:hypothetical protein